MTYHLANWEYLSQVGRPSQAKTGDTLVLTRPSTGYEGGGCRGNNITIPAGKYKIVSRKHFVGGSQEIEVVL